MSRRRAVVAATALTLIAAAGGVELARGAAEPPDGSGVVDTAPADARGWSAPNRDAGAPRRG